MDLKQLVHMPSQSDNHKALDYQQLDTIADVSPVNLVKTEQKLVESKVKKS